MSITNFITNTDFPAQVFQGDNFEVELTVNAVLTGYKCRVSVYDKDSNSLSLATANVTDGADTQVLITVGASSSVIKVFVPKDETDSFNENSFIEVELENASSKVYTILKQKFRMIPENLTWTDV